MKIAVLTQTSPDPNYLPQIYLWVWGVQYASGFIHFYNRSWKNENKCGCNFAADNGFDNGQ